MSTQNQNARKKHDYVTIVKSKEAHFTDGLIEVSKIDNFTNLLAGGLKTSRNPFVEL